MKIRIIMLAGVIAAVCSLGLAVRSVSAQNYNVANDFSTTSNPNGVWSYGYISSGDLNMSNFTLFNTPAWSNNGNSDPNVYHNPGAAVNASSADAYNYIAANAVLMGPYQGPSDIRWTAPQSGLIDLQSSAENVQSCCGTRAVNYDVVFDNNAPAFSQNLPGLPAQPADPTAPGAFPTATFDGLFYVTKGETINFLAYNGGGGDNNTMQLNADIGYVPEPSSLVALCALGAAGILLALRRSRGK